MATRKEPPTPQECDHPAIKIKAWRTQDGAMVFACSQCGKMIQRRTDIPRVLRDKGDGF